MQVVERYKEVFGDLDHNVTIGGIEFIFVDAQALDGEYHPNLSMTASSKLCIDLVFY